jgi:hypothetical protein
MPFLPFPEYRPDVDDFMGQQTQVLAGVLPRGDGWGPMPALQAYSSTLPEACRGFFYARKSDGTIIVFGATKNRLFTLNNTSLGWTPVSKVTALTSISNGSPAVFTKNSHGLPNDFPLVLSTTGSLPTGLAVGTIYYVVNSAPNTFSVATAPGGSAVNTSSAGSGTHSMTYFYADVPTTDQWQFAQFGNFVVAVQANESPQVFDLSSATAFSNLSGSPPTARYVAVVGRFLVLCGLVSNPKRVHWSDLDGITTWSPGTGFANSVDLPDGGVVRGVAGGEFGVILQESTARRMTYVAGQKPAFQIERIAEELGLLGPYSIARAGGRVLFFSPQGFQEYLPGAGLRPIGKEKVDRTILADLDTANLRLFIGAADPSGTRVFWAYKSIAGGVQHRVRQGDLLRHCARAVVAADRDQRGVSGTVGQAWPNLGRAGYDFDIDGRTAVHARFRGGRAVGAPGRGRHVAPARLLRRCQSRGCAGDLRARCGRPPRLRARLCGAHRRGGRAGQRATPRQCAGGARTHA